MVILTIPIIQFGVNWKEKDFKNAWHKLLLPNVVNIANLLIAVIVLGLTLKANNDGAELLKNNQRFLETSEGFLKTALSLNQETQNFVKTSSTALQVFDDQSKGILSGAGEMNKRSRDFLEASQGSLETFRKTADELQKVLQSNIDLANKQVEIMTDSYKHEVELLNRKADIDVSLWNVSLTKQINTSFPFESNSKEEWKLLPFAIVNSGSIPLKNPIIIFQAFPSSVCINSKGDHSVRAEDANTLQLSSTLLPIYSGTPYSYPVEVKVPQEVKQFSVVVEISGEGLPSRTDSTVAFKVNEPKLSK